MKNFSRLVGERIKLAREESNLSQEKLSELVGFNDRQTLSTIEVGQRQISPEELVCFAKILSRPLEYFTDPYRAAGRNAFSYRAKGATKAELNVFEAQAGRVIAAYRRFQELLDQPPSPVQPQISTITSQVPLDFAAYMGERCAAAWQLGEAPAQRLRTAATKILGVVVLFVDAPKSISGAACRLEDGAYVLINRHETAERQNFDLGHEIFHILTWEKMPPDRVDQVQSDASPQANRPKAEKLADSYTGGLLMPSETVNSRWTKRNTLLPKWLSSTAAELGVSPPALFWRLVNLGLLKNSPGNRDLMATARCEVIEARPALFSTEFVRNLHKVLENGSITVRRAMSLLELDQGELKELFASYKMEAPFDL